MTKAIENQYIPDYVSPPGESLEEILEERGITQAELAERMGRPKKTINEIIKGKAAITEDTALQLELVLGTPAHFWNNRERLYREYLARQEEYKKLKAQTGWLKQFPCRAMINLNWIEEHNDKVKQLKAVLSFFGVASPEQWEEIFKKNLSVDFRKSQTFDSDLTAVAAWLRKGEIEAAKIPCSPYDENKFREALQQIRALTTKPLEIFHPEMIRLCATCGVAVVFVPELPKTRVCGATRWLTPNKALLQLSLRHKSDDHLWFAFFHEAAHILLHGKRDVFLEVQNGEKVEKPDKEKEADNLAANFLIPPIEWKRFIELNQPSPAAIIQFASELGIAPGIVVGRLQHESILPYSHCNSLKRRFEGKM